MNRLIRSWTTSADHGAPIRVINSPIVAFSDDEARPSATITQQRIQKTTSNGSTDALEEFCVAAAGEHKTGGSLADGCTADCGANVCAFAAPAASWSDCTRFALASALAMSVTALSIRAPWPMADT